MTIKPTKAASSVPSSPSISMSMKQKYGTASSRLSKNFFEPVPPPVTLPPPSLQAVRPPEAPLPPSMSPSVIEPVEPSRPGRNRGLFESLIADPRVLFHGLLETPESYESGVSELLQNLVSGRRNREELTQQERELLDRATVEFATAKRPQQDGGATAPSSQAAKTKRPLTPPEEVELIYQDRGPHIPVTADIPDSPPSFWWKK